MRKSGPLLVVLLLTGVAAAVYLALRETDPPAPPPAEVETETPVSEPLLPVEEIRRRHDAPYPFGAFDEVMGTLRQPVDPNDGRTDDEIATGYWKKLRERRITLDLENPNPGEVVAEMARQLEGSGVPCYAGDPFFPEDFRLGPVKIENAPVEVVIDILMRRTFEECKYYMTTRGLVIGPTSAIQKAQFDVREERALARQRRDEQSALLSKEYRPDFVRAEIGGILRQIHAQTGVEIVTDADTWNRTKAVTWRGKPTTLRNALARLCREFGCYYRVHEGRVFLLAP